MIPRHLIIGVAVLLAITLGMGFYVWQMRGRVDRSEVSAVNTQPVAPPVSAPPNKSLCTSPMTTPEYCVPSRLACRCPLDARSAPRKSFAPFSPCTSTGFRRIL